MVKAFLRAPRLRLAPHTIKTEKSKSFFFLQEKSFYVARCLSRQHPTTCFHCALRSHRTRATGFLRQVPMISKYYSSRLGARYHKHEISTSLKSDAVNEELPRKTSAHQPADTPVLPIPSPHKHAGYNSLHIDTYVMKLTSQYGLNFPSYWFLRARKYFCYVGLQRDCDSRRNNSKKKIGKIVREKTPAVRFLGSITSLPCCPRYKGKVKKDD